SADAALAVYIPATITTQPVSQTKTNGNNVTFSVTATGAPLFYQWIFVSLTDTNYINNATNGSYTITNVQSTNAGTYSVLVGNFTVFDTNAPGTVISANAILTVRNAPGITTQPSGLMINQGSNATFTVVATGDPTLTYQWKFNAANIS